MAEKEDTKPAAAGSAKKSKKSGLMIIIAVVVALAAGGGGTWFFLGGDQGGTSEVKAPPVLPPVFVPLENFTVNLMPEPGSGQQYMQIGITLKIAGQEIADKLKVQMPEVRSRLLLLLSSKKASELLSPDGKKKLAQDMITEVSRILDPASVPDEKPAAKPPVNVAAAPAETGTDAAEQPPEADPAAEPAAEPEQAAAEAAPAAALPVLSVLFTSFIIQ